MDSNENKVGKIEGEGSGGTHDTEIMEKNKVQVMKTLLLRQNPIPQEVDDLMLRRFLRARDLNIDKATELLLAYLRWRKGFVPRGSISEDDIKHELSQMKVFLQGSDKTGRPISVIFAGRHIPTKGKEGLQEFKRLMVYCLDKHCERIPRGCEKFISIIDLQGWGYSNSDIHGYMGGLSILQDFYPERLGKLFLVHVPPLFMKAWKIINSFIDNNTKKKIVFVENKNLKETLLHDIEEEQLPEIYGGKLSLVPIQDS